MDIYFNGVIIIFLIFFIIQVIIFREFSDSINDKIYKLDKKIDKLDKKIESNSKKIQELINKKE